MPAATRRHGFVHTPTQMFVQETAGLWSDPDLVRPKVNLHDIKIGTGRGGANNIKPDDFGDVWDPKTGEFLGNILESDGTVAYLLRAGNHQRSAQRRSGADLR